MITIFKLLIPIITQIKTNLFIKKIGKIIMKYYDAVVCGMLFVSLNSYNN